MSFARHALVPELIPGPTLAERIAEGPIPEDRAIDYALQIAGALEAARRAGIVRIVVAVNRLQELEGQLR